MNKDFITIKNILDNHGIIAFPTETVCGLAIKFDDVIAYNKLNQVKHRLPDKPYTMMLASIKDIDKYAYVSEEAKKIINKFMPGKITILLKAKPNIIGHITHNSDKIGIRIPDYPLIRDLINYVGYPLLVPSANRANEKPYINMEDVKKEFRDEVDFYIDGNALGEKSSTVIDAYDTINIVRVGDISLHDINKCLKGEK